MNNIKKYPVTYTLLALCIMTYIATTLLLSIDMNAMQGLAAGGFNPYYVHVTHQYYRLITANFIHFGLMHIVVNCYSLFDLSCFAEYLIGTKKYIIVILASMLSTTGLPYIAYLLFGTGAHTVSGQWGHFWNHWSYWCSLFILSLTASRHCKKLRDECFINVVYIFCCSNNIFIWSCERPDRWFCVCLYYSIYK